MSVSTETISKHLNGWISLGALTAGLAVAAGAFAAHGLDAWFVKEYSGRTHTVTGVETPTAQKFIADFKTAARYQMYHALGMIAVGAVLSVCNSAAVRAAGWCFLIGVILFSGGLYVYTLTGNKLWGAIPPPIGGTLFIIGWVCLAVGCARSRR